MAGSQVLGHTESEIVAEVLYRRLGNVDRVMVWDEVDLETWPAVVPVVGVEWLGRKAGCEFGFHWRREVVLARMYRAACVARQRCMLRPRLPG